MTKQGKTTGNLKMRSGPGMQFEPPIAYLVPDTALEILGEEGDWWQVRAAGKEGYVGKKYVAVTEAAPAAEPAADKATAGLTKPEATMAQRNTGMVKTGGAKPSAVKGQAGKTPVVKSTAVKPGVKPPAASRTPVTKSPAGKPNVKPTPKPIGKTNTRANMPKPGRPRGGTSKR